MASAQGDQKRCPSCDRRLHVSAFWRSRTQPDGLQGWCKDCIRAWRYSYREVERVADREREHRRRAAQRTEAA